MICCACDTSIFQIQIGIIQYFRFSIILFQGVYIVYHFKKRGWGKPVLRHSAGEYGGCCHLVSPWCHSPRLCQHCIFPWDMAQNMCSAALSYRVASHSSSEFSVSLWNIALTSTGHRAISGSYSYDTGAKGDPPRWGVKCGKAHSMSLSPHNVPNRNGTTASLPSTLPSIC